MGIRSGNPTWQDHPDTTTPITAARLNNIENALDALRSLVTTASTAITVASSDHGKFYRLTAATAVTVNLPDGVAVGTQVEFQACDTGLATFVLSGTAAWGPAPVPSAIMLDTGSACTALCVATDTWTVVGRLA